MTIQAVAWSIEQTLEPTDKLVLILLANHGDLRNQCFPSIKLLAVEAGMSRASVFRVLSRLEAKKLIVRQRQQRHSGKGGRGVNLYTISAPLTAKGSTALGLNMTPKQGGLGLKSEGLGLNGETSKSKALTIIIEPSKWTDLEMEAKQFFSEAAANKFKPSPRIVAYDHFKRATGLLIDTQIDKFVDFNPGKRLRPAEWSRLWERWCAQGVQFARQLGN